jgi:nucleoside-diphosphate-sugar epimerase
VDVLVTGAAGYVGSVLVDVLLRGGHRVRAVDSLLHGPAPSLLLAWGEDEFEFVQADVADRAAMREAIEGMEAVVHLAAIVGDPACAREPDLARAINVEATRELVRASKDGGARRFLFASTCSNYGKLEEEGVFATEDWPLRPVSLYAETKVKAENDVLEQSGSAFETCCLRFATVYGVSPRMRFDLTVNEFTRDVVLGGDLVVYGEQFWRPYVHVRDAAAAVLTALEADGEPVAGQVYNVGANEENYRKLDLVELLRARVPSAEIQFVKKDEDPRDYRVSFDRISERLGFRPRHTVSDGIDEVIALLRSGLLDDPYAGVYRN